MTPLACAIALCFLSSAEPVRQLAAGTPMARLLASFQQAKPPKSSDLPGEWVQTKHVSTQRFLNERDGPDLVLSDTRGLRRADQPGHPLEWALSITTGAGGRLRLTSNTAWVPTGDISVASFNAQGELVFQKDFGGDSAWIYRCRVVTADHLVCVLQDHAGHGIEFRKTHASSK